MYILILNIQGRRCSICTVDNNFCSIRSLQTILLLNYFDLKNLLFDQTLKLWKSFLACEYLRYWLLYCATARKVSWKKVTLFLIVSSWRAYLPNKKVWHLYLFFVYSLGVSLKVSLAFSNKNGRFENTIFKNCSFAKKFLKVNLKFALE